MSNKVYTPTTLNTKIKELVNNSFLDQINIEGEISNWKPSSSGHIYFDLKDEESVVSIALWRSTKDRLSHEVFKELKDGSKIEIKGTIDVYVRGGRYNISANEISIAGLGDLWKKFELLKKTLEAKGFFAQEHKKQIQPFNYSVGVITSPTGAVIEDIKTTIQRRFPLVKIHLYPTIVQGPSAKNALIKNLKLADSKKHDVIIIARGGGSLEDLWPFNEEELAIEIFNAKTPIISSVGHETDFTICDFVSDLRAATPTAAAMIITPDWRDLKNDITNNKRRIVNLLSSLLSQKRMFLSEQASKFEQKRNSFVSNLKFTINDLSNNIDNSFKEILNNSKNKVNLIKSRLNDLNPETILGRGYSITKHKGKILKDSSKTAINDELEIILNNGKITTIIKNKEDKNE